jgi:hypothetical protein
MKFSRKEMRLEVYKAYLQEAKWTVDDVDID